MGRPRVYDEELRERLIEEARSMLTADGYHGVSLRVLTRNVGTSTNAVYTLFGSKEALMAEVVVRNLNNLLGDDFDLPQSGSIQDDLIELAHLYRTHATADPRAFSGTFEAMEEARRPGSLTDRINPEVKNISTRLYTPILTLCKRAAEENPDLNLNPMHMAVSVWATIQGFVQLESAGALPVEDDEQVHQIFEESIRALYRGWIDAPVCAKKNMTIEDQES